MSKLLSPKDIVRSGLCIGCGSCVAQANKPDAQMSFDDYGQLKPKGSPAWFNQSSLSFTQTCPFSPGARNEDYLANNLYPTASQQDGAIGRFQSAYVGHVGEEDFRLQGSSGGMVTWVATELMRKGLIDGVAHVIATEDPQADGRYFKYRIARTEAEVRAGAKSRYYPIELSEILKTIREVPGHYAVVGIPCFIKAVQLLRREDPIFRERIRFTLGLFCGHMKSARFVESFAWQMQVPANQIEKVEYRHKDPNRPANWYNARLTLRDGQVVNRDWWHLADGDWGAGFYMNSACNYCDDVVAETADVAFGDAWVEPYSSDGKGTNVVVVRSPLVQNLMENAIEEGRLDLKSVDAAFVQQTQAAGFRQRREGLAYRLTWNKRGVRPRKRVAPDATSPSRHRKFIYRMRFYISAWSNRVFKIARQIQKPQLYYSWARLAAAVYHGLAYHQGKFAEMRKRYSELKA
ncbi:Coenzyme F420 hydrogenase/dehydrogenase, beta subunit C-terminal domain [Adhaeribacter radiodurans]|uniref:Coenzyme F420 hydrogenase/dehydrogenase, beta subunit C-terminal domain n=1 Tax=Adhaeribacter radiodurans TaxID=2745197 RepID=A0A7L7L9K2_9BACT|nr:Coenzyme F420 hydrogenase/dehydrogenase, beta subunit C-terminal domain [Adhaeribacter radiodurans]QMU29205.1 Coenzyme F420 hydrogenase/dehydrogenase, beta subunit C-terminal domain [Adhaeribacter radiodurans]